MSSGSLFVIRVKGGQGVDDAPPNDRHWLHSLGYVLVVLAFLHACALAFWLYQLTITRGSSEHTTSTKKFKKFTATYDFDDASEIQRIQRSQSRSGGPLPRNRSVPCLQQDA